MTTVRTLNPMAPQPPEKIGRMSPDHHFQSTGWTFLSNHAYVLIELNANPEQVLREVATKVGITERAVQRIVHDLEEEGYLTHERVGRRNRYRVVAGKSLRHPLASHKTIEALVQLLISGPEEGRATEPAICQE